LHLEDIQEKKDQHGVVA